jgi:hypothetical protein
LDVDNFCRFQRAKPVIIDPGLYMTKKADVFWITQRRSVPTAFKLFTGMRFRTLNLTNVSCYLLCFDFSDVVSASSIVEPCLPHVIFVTYILLTMNAIMSCTLELPYFKQTKELNETNLH